MKTEYYFKNGEFVIENFDKQRAFTSFLPAIAGKKGIPLWTFYINRGQGISSFGIQDKNGAILEFFPAYSAYQVIGKIGFRTFIKVNNRVHEIFNVNNPKAIRTMYIQREQFRIEEINKTLGLKIAITYFGLPNENIAALVRKVEINNLLSLDQEIEVIDGLSQILLPGVEHGPFKVMSNLYRSWMDVYNLENNSAFYKLRASLGDSEEVNEVNQGNFYFSFVDSQLVKPIVDPFIIFNEDKTFTNPHGFVNNSADELRESPQYPQNKVPCGFTCLKYSLKASKTLRIDTLLGRMHSLEAFNEIVPQLTNTAFIDRKQQENIDIVEVLMKNVEVNTANTLFDEYVKNNFLDNMLRGGYPAVFNATNNKQFIYYLYSRRHGDPERDYNFFHIAPEYYSQGNGNFRDICQNRRCDSLINRHVKDYNLEFFMNLIQLDGYNPLGINGATFEIEDKNLIEYLVKQNFDSHQELLIKILNGKFTPGSIVNTVENNKIKTKVSEEEYLANILGDAKQNIEASFGEGFWSDHFSYLLDLLENYLAVYPDYEEEVLFDKNHYKYFESPAYVNPRVVKTVLTNHGTVRQYGALYHHDDVKIKKFNLNPHATNWAKDITGNILVTNLYAKLFTLAFNKFALLDNHGIGIEMEGGKPGWNDAMNGLPGLFGSGVSETFETLRIVRLLCELTKKYKDKTALIPSEFMDFYNQVIKLLKANLHDFEYWDLTSNAREAYREILRKGIVSSNLVKIASLYDGLKLMEHKLTKAIDKAYQIGNGVYPTFIVYEVTKYEHVYENGEFKRGYKNLPIVKPLEFKLRLLPNFLEAPARALKVVKEKNKLATMYQEIKKSDIYDPQLKMYKTSGDLTSETQEIGRIRAFTKGWLERESNFMHMTYKYLFGLLKAELYNEFFEAVKTNLVCNMNPKIYGRSPLEASSFIATSCNPDPELHGQGFVARLSGTTAEMLSIYYYMMMGGQPFVMKDGELYFALQPKLRKEYFKDGQVSFTLLGDIKITYIIEKARHTYNGVVPLHYELIGQKTVKTETVKGENAKAVREGKYPEIKVYLG